MTASATASTTRPTTGAGILRWEAVCRYTDLIPERGVAALVGGEPVAVFRTYDGALYALSNVDPFSEASVLSRGIVGDRHGRPTIASPIYKQVFDRAPGTAWTTRPSAW